MPVMVDCGFEWVKKISDASNNTAALTWVQINIDWWLD